MLSNLGFDLRVDGKKWDSRFTNCIRTNKTTSIYVSLLLVPELEQKQTFEDVIPVKGCSAEHEAQVRRSGSASWNRSSSEIWDSSGSIVVSVGFIGPTDRN